MQLAGPEPPTSRLQVHRVITEVGFCSFIGFFDSKEPLEFSGLISVNCFGKGQTINEKITFQNHCSNLLSPASIGSLRCTTQDICPVAWLLTENFNRELGLELAI
uniref:Uncharacterized protein n=1 Tax=Cacopsylla melanoneura TaxID=428564 RepID=A0A8D8U3S5_9HEMI